MSTTENTVRVWHPAIRIGHWTLVVTFFTAYFTEDDFLAAHVWAGYALGAVVLFRLTWGLTGSGYVRFSNFVRPPAAVFGYLAGLFRRSSRRYLGHNPAGGAMVLALLACLAGTAISGIVLYGIEEGAGPLAAWVAEGSASEEWWEEMHEVLANLTLLLVGVHVAGVILSGRAHRENLVKAMITGRKRSADD